MQMGVGLQCQCEVLAFLTFHAAGGGIVATAAAREETDPALPWPRSMPWRSTWRWPPAPRRGEAAGYLTAGGVSDVFTANSARPRFHRLDTAGSDKMPRPQHPQPTMTLGCTSTHGMLKHAEIIEIV